MFTHTPGTISLHNMATRLSQIRLFHDSSRQTNKEPFNRTTIPAKPTKRAMYSAQQVPQNRMAQPAARSQQARTRRPHSHAHLQENSDRSYPGSACPLSKTPRRDSYQDWHRQDEANLIKPLPRRRPLESVDPNIERRSTPSGQRQGWSKRKASIATPQAHPRMSEMHSLIDDYLAWNQSCSDLQRPRPDSSGTMFVDFGSNGEMEVSYRNGPNKKLPIPPVPSKMPTPPKSTPTHHQPAIKGRTQPHPHRKEARPSKPLPPRPSYSSRHDSVVSSAAQNKDLSRSHQAPSLPRLPSQTPHHAHPQSRKPYPPQVHRTRRSSSQTAQAAPPSPNPSHISTSTYHTAPSSHNTEAYTVIEPGGLTMHFHPTFTTDYTNNSTSSSTRGVITGHDCKTNYTYTYDGHTMHVHRSPTASRPGSWTSEYFDVTTASCYSTSPDLSVDCCTKLFTRDSTHDSADSGGPLRKPLPPLPGAPGYMRSSGYIELPEVPRKDARKRHKVRRFVKRVLGKLDQMGGMKELGSHHYQRDAPHGGSVDS